MAKKASTKPAKPEKIDPDVEAANRALGFTPPAAAAPDPAKSLEELNGTGPGEVPQPHINRRQYDRPVHTKLEGEEFDQVTHSMLAAMNERDQLEESKKAVVCEWKGILDRKDEEIQAFRGQLNHGRKEVVSVEEVRDLNAGTITVFRLDTNEIIEGPRPMTKEEQQLDLNGLDSAPPSEDHAPAAVDGSQGEDGLQQQQEERQPGEGNHIAPSGGLNVE